MAIFKSLGNIPVETTSYKCKCSSWMGNLNWFQMVPGVGPKWLHVEIAIFQLKPAETNAKPLKKVKASHFTLM